MKYLARLPFALERASKVVDHDIGTSRAKEKGVCSTKPTAGSSDDNRLAVKAELV